MDEGQDIKQTETESQDNYSDALLSGLMDKTRRAKES